MIYFFFFQINFCFNWWDFALMWQSACQKQKQDFCAENRIFFLEKIVGFFVQLGWQLWCTLLLSRMRVRACAAYIDRFIRIYHTYVMFLNSFTVCWWMVWHKLDRHFRQIWVREWSVLLQWNEGRVSKVVGAIGRQYVWNISNLICIEK